MLGGLKLGFIGAGNMAAAILNGVLERGLVAPGAVWLSNRSPEKLAPFAARGVHTTLDNRDVVREAELVVLAVKPQMLPEVLPGVADLMGGKCAVSIAAGRSSQWLGAQLPRAQIVRAMPNTPLMVGAGATAVARAPGVPEDRFQAVLDLFACAGIVEVIDENQMDDIINVNGSTPAFFFRMADSLVRRAADMGIDRGVALRLAAKTMEGAGRLLLETAKEPADLERQVCSPGGTTLAALSAFDELDFDGLLREAMDRCSRRSRELGQ